MRGQTIRFGNVRRSTKHFKVGRKCYPISKKWDAFMEMLDTEHNKKMIEEGKDGKLK